MRKIRSTGMQAESLYDTEDADGQQERLNLHELSVRIRHQVRGQLEWEQSITDEELERKIEQCLFSSSEVSMMSASEMRQVVKRVYHSFRGLDVLQPLVDDPAVTEIMINGPEEIFIERKGLMLQSEIRFESADKLEDVIQAIVGQVNRVVNESTPIVDARLADGSRVHVVLPPIALKGPTVTIRKFPERPMTMEDLVQWGALHAEAAMLLKQLVKAKYNIFISGGTGSGKTTFLNALSQYIPADERVITIEDAAELQIVTVPNLVSLETRNANTEGKGAIPMRDLIRASLRMRPNRIVVGEVRGAEALDMLQAMNTGHDGSLSTGHANGAQDMMSRLETMVLSGAHLPLAVVRQQIASALDIVVHLARIRDGSRKVIEIAEVMGMEGGEIKLSPLYRFEETGEQESRVLGQLRSDQALNQRWKLKMAGIVLSDELEVT
ncbi:CpaF family protein [Paenibacillus aquistagni]|uniref:Pilus assembly protein CpaF n=1 Tax=Paenibacillus aquistagni TaxID=1852522 RepID=A0A1X7K3X6_9BACL|nr:CpaF family protein [Paenibacillus aquistagni]SMG35434.1 pilus assembly protein CpaF [Paenibacillus aquistagni]